MASVEEHRRFYATWITAAAGVPKSSLTDAFTLTPRERFLGPGPWSIVTSHGYVDTPSADPSFLYQDVVVALDRERRINNGQPTLHAQCLAALKVRSGETAIHVGAGTGYYTAVLARLVSTAGHVDAYEIDRELAARAAARLGDLPQATVHAGSGAEAPLPATDVLYVSAGATEPLAVWLDALRIGGRLLFPMTPDATAKRPGAGAMLLITREGPARFAARFLFAAMFIPCVGARNPITAARLEESFERGDFHRVRSLRRTKPDKSCWVAGDDWWLSTAEERGPAGGQTP